MVTGSVASSLQGEPRTTHDLDLVVSIHPGNVAALLQAFAPPQFYLDEGSIQEAIGVGGMFNAINVSEGDKIDFWLLTDEPFDRSRFSRKTRENVLGFWLNVSAPEDTILAKLRWSMLSGGSTKLYVDALRVFEVQAHRIDMAYIGRWARELGISDLWDRLQAEAQLPP